MTMKKLCEICEMLNQKFNTAAREMDGRELAAYRRKLKFRYAAVFVNGWTVRLNRRVEDVFTVETAQIWTRSEKGMLGKMRSAQKLRLTLRSQALPDTIIKCITSADEPPCVGAQIRVCGELEAVLFLHPEGVQWKSAEFVKSARVSEM